MMGRGREEEAWSMSVSRTERKGQVRSVGVVTLDRRLAQSGPVKARETPMLFRHCNNDDDHGGYLSIAAILLLFTTLRWFHVGRRLWDN
jgi:hypothetical protein